MTNSHLTTAPERDEYEIPMILFDVIACNLDELAGVGSPPFCYTPPPVLLHPPSFATPPRFCPSPFYYTPPR